MDSSALDPGSSGAVRPGDIEAPTGHAEDSGEFLAQTLSAAMDAFKLDARARAYP